MALVIRPDPTSYHDERTHLCRCNSLDPVGKHWIRPSMDRLCWRTASLVRLLPQLWHRGERSWSAVSKADLKKRGRWVYSPVSFYGEKSPVFIQQPRPYVGIYPPDGTPRGPCVKMARPVAIGNVSAAISPCGVCWRPLPWERTHQNPTNVRASTKATCTHSCATITVLGLGRIAVN